MNDLTEKMKKKQLERGSYYYVKTKMGNILIDCINYDRPNHDGFLYDVEEVLAPVPNYQRFKELKYGFDTFISQIPDSGLSQRYLKAEEENVLLKGIVKRLEDEADLRETKTSILIAEYGELYQLLKECHNQLSKLLVDGAELQDKEVINLLTKIEEVQNDKN